jgi:hypothetical protein
MQVGSLGDDEEMLKAIGETSEGMAVDTHVEKAQADAAAAAVPDEAARMAEGVAAQETPRLHEEAPWRIQGARRPQSANASEMWEFRPVAIQLQGTTASVQEMWEELTRDQQVPMWPTWMPVWYDRGLELHRSQYLPLQMTPLAKRLLGAGKMRNWMVLHGGKIRLTDVVHKRQPTAVTSPPETQTRPSLPSRTVPSAQLPADVTIHNRTLGNAWSKKPAALQQESTAAAPVPSHAEQQEMGARISVLEEKFELFSRQSAPAAAPPAATPAPAFVFASPPVPQPPTAIESQLRIALQEAKAVTDFQAARWDTELEKMAVREKKKEEEMAELRALLASKIKENEQLRAAIPQSVYNPAQFGPRAQLTIRQQEQPPQEEEMVFTVEVKMATPEKVTSQQSQYDASPEVRGSVSREGGRSRSPSPISSPRAAAAAAKQQPNRRSQHQPIRKDLLLQWEAQVEANVAEVAALLEADTEEEAAAELAQAAAAEAAAAAGAKGTGSGQFRVGDTESDEDSEKDEEVSESDDYGGMWQ